MLEESDKSAKIRSVQLCNEKSNYGVRLKSSRNEAMIVTRCQVKQFIESMHYLK